MQFHSSVCQVLCSESRACCCFDPLLPAHVKLLLLWLLPLQPHLEPSPAAFANIWCKRSLFLVAFAASSAALRLTTLLSEAAATTIQQQRQQWGVICRFAHVKCIKQPRQQAVCYTLGKQVMRQAPSSWHSGPNPLRLIMLTCMLCTAARSQQLPWWSHMLHAGYGHLTRSIVRLLAISSVATTADAGVMLHCSCSCCFTFAISILALLGSCSCCSLLTSFEKIIFLSHIHVFAIIIFNEVP